MLRLHNDNLSSISLISYERNPVTFDEMRHTLRGRQALFRYLELLEDTIEKEPEFEDLVQQTDDPVRDIVTGFYKFYEKFRPEFGNYFITIYEILSIIDQTTLDVDRSLYGRILRSQLASWETLLLAYYCIADQQLSPTMMRYVNKYALLEFLEPIRLQKMEELGQFKQSAFGFN